jgi:hypothetical protein
MNIGIDIICFPDLNRTLTIEYEKLFEYSHDKSDFNFIDLLISLRKHHNHRTKDINLNEINHIYIRAQGADTFAETVDVLLDCHTPVLVLTDITLLTKLTHIHFYLFSSNQVISLTAEEKNSLNEVGNFRRDNLNIVVESKKIKDVLPMIHKPDFTNPYAKSNVIPPPLVVNPHLSASSHSHSSPVSYNASPNIPTGMQSGQLVNPYSLSSTEHVYSSPSYDCYSPPPIEDSTPPYFTLTFGKQSYDVRLDLECGEWSLYEKFLKIARHPPGNTFGTLKPKIEFPHSCKESRFREKKYVRLNDRSFGLLSSIDKQVFVMRVNFLYAIQLSTDISSRFHTMASTTAENFLKGDDIIFQYGLVFNRHTTFLFDDFKEAWDLDRELNNKSPAVVQDSDVFMVVKKMNIKRNGTVTEVEANQSPRPEVVVLTNDSHTLATDKPSDQSNHTIKDPTTKVVTAEIVTTKPVTMEMEDIIVGLDQTTDDLECDGAIGHTNSKEDMKLTDKIGTKPSDVPLTHKRKSISFASTITEEFQDDKRYRTDAYDNNNDGNVQQVVEPILPTERIDEINPNGMSIYENDSRLKAMTDDDDLNIILLHYNEASRPTCMRFVLQGVGYDINRLHMCVNNNLKLCTKAHGLYHRSTPHGMKCIDYIKTSLSSGTGLLFRDEVLAYYDININDYAAHTQATPPLEIADLVLGINPPECLKFIAGCPPCQTPECHYTHALSQRGSNQWHHTREELLLTCKSGTSSRIEQIRPMLYEYYDLQPYHAHMITPQSPRYKILQQKLSQIDMLSNISFDELKLQDRDVIHKKLSDVSEEYLNELISSSITDHGIQYKDTITTNNFIPLCPEFIRDSYDTIQWNPLKGCCQNEQCPYEHSLRPLSSVYFQDRDEVKKSIREGKNIREIFLRYFHLQQESLFYHQILNQPITIMDFNDFEQRVDRKHYRLSPLWECTDFLLGNCFRYRCCSIHAMPIAYSKRWYKMRTKLLKKLETNPAMEIRDIARQHYLLDQVIANEES